MRGSMDSQALGAARSRRGFYRILATGYLQEPGTGFVGTICHPALLADLEDAFDRDCVLPLKRFRKTFKGNCRRVFLDYQALFKAPLKRYVAPYESVYLDGTVREGRREDGFIMGPSHRSVAAFYSRAGHPLSSHCGELADYIGNELDFISHLCGEEVEAILGGERSKARSCREVERQFLEEHLGKWVQRLAARILSKAATGLYKGMALITSAFVLDDLEALRESRSFRVFPSAG